MVTVNGEEVSIEVDERYNGQAEVNAITDQGAYVIASFNHAADAEWFANKIKEEGREYKTKDYRII